MHLAIAIMPTPILEKDCYFAYFAAEALEDYKMIFLFSHGFSYLNHGQEVKLETCKHHIPRESDQSTVSRQLEGFTWQDFVIGDCDMHLRTRQRSSCSGIHPFFIVFVLSISVIIVSGMKISCMIGHGLVHMIHDLEPYDHHHYREHDCRHNGMLFLFHLMKSWLVQRMKRVSKR